MAMVEEEKAAVPAVTREDVKWLNRRIDSMNERIGRLSKKISLVIAVMVDKKLIGEELAKRIVQESKVGDFDWNDDELVNWLLGTLKKE